VGEGLKHARQAQAYGQPGRAIGIFTQVIAGWPGFLANAARAQTALVPAYRQLIPCQIDDLEAMERLGIRFDARSKLNLPVAMVCGERSPDVNKDMVAAVAHSLPRVERIVLRGQAYGGQSEIPNSLRNGWKHLPRGL
jgi:hypothetical protein